MKIAIAQMNVVPGNPALNFKVIKSFIEDAIDNGAHLLCLPEMCVGGYLIGDLYRDPEYMRELMRYNELIRKQSKRIAIAYGNVYQDETKKGRDGRPRLYNAVYIYSRCQPAHQMIGLSQFAENGMPRVLPEGVTFKTNLPNYRFFDDERYFFSMRDVAMETGIPLPEFFAPFQIPIDSYRNEQVGFALCEDLWCEDYPYEDGVVNPTKWLIERGAEVICNLSASPWTHGKTQARHNRVKFIAKTCQGWFERKSLAGPRRRRISFKPFCYVNAVGVQNNGKNIITFDGGSTYYNKKGLPCKVADTPYEESLLIVDTKEDVEKCKKPKVASPIVEKTRAIIRGLRGLRDIGGWKENPVITIGLSGGIDSAVAAALHALAFGIDNVVAINMPTKFNSAETRNAAKSIADNIGIRYHSVPMGDMVSKNELSLDAYSLARKSEFGLSDWKGKELPSIVQENIQAKLRAVAVLSNIAQFEGVAQGKTGLFSCNGNKVELYLGYYTLDGDGRGGVNPIGDLTKREVYEMAEYINTLSWGDVIPKELIPDDFYQFGDDKIKPSAELKDDQVDPIKVGYHCSLVDAFLNYQKRTPSDIMRWWLEGNLAKNLNIDPALITFYGMNDAKTFIDDLKWFCDCRRAAVAKRVQSVPIIVTSKTSFGYDLRESILPPFEWTTEAKSLKKKILAQGMYEYKTSSANTVNIKQESVAPLL